MRRSLAVAMVGVNRKLVMKVASQLAESDGKVVPFENWRQMSSIATMCYVVMDCNMTPKDIQTLIRSHNFKRVIWVDDKVKGVSERLDCCAVDKARLQLFQSVSDIRIIGTMRVDDLENAISRIRQTLNAYQDYMNQSIYNVQAVI